MSGPLTFGAPEPAAAPPPAVAVRPRGRSRIIVLAIVVVLVGASVVAAVAAGGGKGGGGSNAPGSQAAVNLIATRAGCPSSPATAVNTLQWTTAPALTINQSLIYDATFVTTAGTFVVQLDAKTAPITTNNFVFLARHRFYDCVIFHRAIPGFMIQGGDPTGTGAGGPGYTIADENPPVGNPTYPDFSIAMANSGQPHSGGSQFFIVTGTVGETLPNSYALFGRVVSGTAVVMTIQNDGNADPAANGVPPRIIQRILTVTISTRNP